MIKVVALITHLYNKLGHRYIYHLSFREAVQKLGLPYTGFTNENCPINDMPKEWEKCLHWKEEKSYLKKIGQLISRTKDFCKIFNKKNAPHEKRFFFLESLCRMDLLALVISFFFSFKKSDFFLLFFGIDLSLSSKKKVFYYTLLLKLAKFKLKHRLIYVTDSEGIVVFFRSLKETCYLLPIPLNTHLPIYKKSSTKPITLWWPGEPREEKGAKEISYLCKRADIHAEKFQLRLSNSAKIFIFEKALPIHFLNAELTEEEYQNELMQCDVILLPYNPQAYRERTSGIFVETISAGKIPFVKEGSWLAKELKKHHLDELIVNWEREDFLSHIYFIIHDLSMHAKLDSMKREYQKFHSIDTYTKTLKDILRAVK